ncbi:DUF2189 domain-containing protein [Hyphobacterium marinum]|uniref:DUF2189 domain-containing protein n=1 Tax=Hyphobacterium marinum TaxID=3116574 RepID=A0ABU7LU45_9PROT|nr:DUF2189 domain-containing protein [Hyphobacterium sp. Y6023]MEE2565070.1 DUF2189 domain-containing protein [Hyphobacterium sp. Y6023]
MVTLQTVRRDAPWSWLKAGWRDLVRAPMVSIGYGLIFVVTGLAITAGLWSLGMTSWIPVATAGFALVAPAFAIGFYQVSRKLDAGETPRFSHVWLLRPGKITQVALLGVFLIILLLFWVLIAQALYAYFAFGNFRPIGEFSSFALATPRGLTLLAVGTIAGGILAAFAFSISALAFPMLVDQEVDAVTALVASVMAVRAQPFVMLTWAWLIAFWTILGTVAFLLGLAVIFPWLGHASWRAYQDFSPVPSPSRASAAAS